MNSHSHPLPSLLVKGWGFALFLLFVSITATAQDIRIKSFERNLMDPGASLAPVKDANGVPCARIRFSVQNRNLKVEGTITTANKFAGGLVGRNRGVIRGCYIDVTINSEVAGDATHGGVAAVTNRGALIEDCLVKTSILGESTICCGGVVGWAEERTNIVNCLVINDGSTFDSGDKGALGHSSNLARAESNTKAVNLETYIEDPYGNRPGGACYNNYVTVDWGGTNPATTVVPYEDLADGRICYQLNNDQSRIAWVQNIGTDEFPVPAAFGTGTVYASAATDCDGKAEGELTFSNTGSDQATKHEFDKYGVCTTCGCFNFNAFDFDNPARFDQAERAILLGSVADIDLAEGWSRVANGLALNMKLTNDLTYEAETGEYIFNASDLVVGNFNGDGHTLTIEMSNLKLTEEKSVSVTFKAPENGSYTVDGFAIILYVFLCAQEAA